MATVSNQIKQSEPKLPGPVFVIRLPRCCLSLFLSLSSTLFSLAFTLSAAGICLSEAVSTSENNCRKQRSPLSARFPSTTCLDKIQIERLEDLPVSGPGVCPSVARTVTLLALRIGRTVEQGDTSSFSVSLCLYLSVCLSVCLSLLFKIL